MAAVHVPLEIAKSWHPLENSAAAVFVHDASPAAQAQGLGGEVMASALVAGPPDECLAALAAAPRSGSGPLGPAARAAWVDDCACSDGSGSGINSGKWSRVVALLLPPPRASAAALVCAPRAAVLRLTRTDRADGVALLMFESVPRGDAARALTAAGFVGGGAARGWGGGWWRPVLMTAVGGYSVVGLPPPPGAAAAAAAATAATTTTATQRQQPQQQQQQHQHQESLVTGVVRADLGGWLAGPQLFGPPGAERGWRATLKGAFVDLMLEAVPRAKAEVESGRAAAYAAEAFALPPLQPRGAPAPQPPPPPTLQSRALRLSSTGGAAVAAAAAAVSGTAAALARGTASLLRRAGSAASGELAALLMGRQAPQPAPLQRGGSAAGAAAAAADRAARGSLDPSVWRELHRGGDGGGDQGATAPFKVRGPTYLADRRKVDAGAPEFALAAVELAWTPGARAHVAPALPSVRASKAPFLFVVDMAVPTPPTVTHCVFVFAAPPGWRRPGEGSDGGGGGGGSDRLETPFSRLMARFLRSSDEQRSFMLKMIPRIDRGPWALKQMVGMTPVIMGRKLATTYHVTDRYAEVDIDVASCRTAAYIVSMVRGATAALRVDLAYLLEGAAPEELPESLLGAVRLDGLDLAAAVPLGAD